MASETLTREFRSEHDADVWLDRLANTRGLAGASFTQLGGGRLRVTARVTPTTAPANPAEQPQVTSPEQLTLGW
ncbi:MAG TPA: hypothetical protein VGL02_20605 [Streptomyces sp.]